MTPEKFADVDRLPARIADPTPLGALAPTVSGGALMLQGEGAAGPSSRSARTSPRS